MYRNKWRVTQRSRRRADQCCQQSLGSGGGLVEQEGHRQTGLSRRKTTERKETQSGRRATMGITAGEPHGNDGK